MGRPVPAVQLDRDWDVSSLLGETFRLFGRFAGLFLPLSAIIAVPYVVVTDLLWGEELAASNDLDPSWPALLLPFVLGATVVPAMITALHVVSVLRLARGERPSVGEAFGEAADRVGPVIGATVLYLAAVMLGFVLLIIPGIYLMVRLFVTVPAAAAEPLGAAQALRRSAELTRGRWWQTFGRFALSSIVFGLLTIPLSIPLGFIDFGVTYVILDCLLQTVTLSLSALFGTLVYVDYRGAARTEAPPAAAYGGFEPPQPPGPRLP